jgi:hypothetical protein
MVDGFHKTTSKAARFPWLRVSFFIFACAFLIIGAGPLPEKIWRKWKGNESKLNKRPSSEKQEESKEHSPDAKASEVKSSKEDVAKPVIPKPVIPKPVIPKPVIPKPPTEHIATSGGNIRTMSKGFTLKTKFTVDKDGNLASKERRRKDSYVASYELKITLPKPSTTLKSLEEVSPELGKILPGLKEAMPKAQVSPFFYQAYANKVKRIKSKSLSLSELMTQHNFYDCETILNLKHPKTGRRALLLQSEMDVVSDGSDGDRLPTMPEKIVNSSYYQPMTSYGWKKTGKTPNPLIKGWKGRIQKANAEIAKKGTSAERKAWLKMRIKKIKREIQDMQYRSYLIAEYDPFIVMPINMITSKTDRYAAHVGDYAVVIYKGKIYPTIVGDAGPSFKTGEASLRIAKQLNSRAGIYSRPVSDLTVTYLVFPKTAEKPHRAPDYAHWKLRCEELLADFGGLGEKVELFTWKNTLPPMVAEKKPQEDVEKKSQNSGKQEGADATSKEAKATEDSKAPVDSSKKSEVKPPVQSSGKKEGSKLKKSTSPSMPLPRGVFSS